MKRLTKAEAVDLAEKLNDIEGTALGDALETWGAEAGEHDREDVTTAREEIEGEFDSLREALLAAAEIVGDRRFP